MKKMLSAFLDSGLWAMPVLMTLIIHVARMYNPRWPQNKDDWLVCVALALIPTVFIFIDTLNRPRAENALQGKEKAKYPPIAKELLYNEPRAVIFGKDKKTKKYVCKDVNDDGHCLVIGGSGSGKSSAGAIPSLILANKSNHVQVKNQKISKHNSQIISENIRILALDIKGELSFISSRYDDSRVKIFNPDDRTTIGYDPLYRLSNDSSTQKILEVMENISHALISLPADIKDPFWKNSARNLLTGLLIYYYKKGFVDFVGIIDEMLSKTARQSVEEAMMSASSQSVEYRYLVQFAEMEDETLGSIVAEMNNHIGIFVNDANIRYAFKENPLKLNPDMLEKGYDIYLSIKEENLTRYYDVTQLILNQAFLHLEGRDPESKTKILFLIDELPRVLSQGKLDRLLDGSRTLRSRGVTLYLVTQSTEALMSAYTENQVADLISNCAYITVMSASSPKTQRMICGWCGKFLARKQSWSDTGKNRKSTISFEEKDVVEPSELMTLQHTGEAILVTPYGYCRIKKVPYYKDKYLKKIAKANKKHNKVLMKAKEELS